MRRIEQDAPPGSAHQDTLTLPFELRCKSRLRVRLDSGVDAALLLPRGRVLRGGDLLRADDGSVVLVCAASENVSTASGLDAIGMARAAYHLGNRHVPIQVGSGFLRYQHDHVLDDMVRSLGLTVRDEQAPFEPEGGAYAGAPHAHAHEHAHPSPAAHSHALAPAHSLHAQTHPHSAAHDHERERERERALALERERARARERGR